jgi:hypothetical protein
MQYSLVAICLCLFLLSGCSTLSPWGNYEQDLFFYYHDPDEQEYFYYSLQKHLTLCEEKGIKPAPGLYAELGTLCLKQQDYQCATKQYQAEMQTWPESAVLMTSLIRSTKRMDR